MSVPVRWVAALYSDHRSSKEDHSSLVPAPMTVGLLTFSTLAVHEAEVGSEAGFIGWVV